MVWRIPREEFDPKCTIPTTKHSDGSVMVWGCFTRQRVGKLCILNCIMDSCYYRDILKQNLQLSTNRFNLIRSTMHFHAR